MIKSSKKEMSKTSNTVTPFKATATEFKDEITSFAENIRKTQKEKVRKDFRNVVNLVNEAEANPKAKKNKKEPL